MDLPGDLSFIVHPSLVRAPANTKKCNLQCTSRQLRQDIDIFSFPRHPRGGRTCRGGTEEENRKKKRGAKSQSRIDPSRRVKCQAGSLSPICFIFGFRSNQMSNPAIRPDRAVASSGMGFSAHVAQRPYLSFTTMTTTTTTATTPHHTNHVPGGTGIRPRTNGNGQATEELRRQQRLALRYNYSGRNGETTPDRDNA